MNTERAKQANFYNYITYSIHYMKEQRGTKNANNSRSTYLFSFNKNKLAKLKLLGHNSSIISYRKKHKINWR